jgi:hypothetical protein
VPGPGTVAADGQAQPGAGAAERGQQRSGRQDEGLLGAEVAVGDVGLGTAALAEVRVVKAPPGSWVDEPAGLGLQRPLLAGGAVARLQDEPVVASF